MNGSWRWSRTKGDVSLVRRALYISLSITVLCNAKRWAKKALCKNMQKWKRDWRLSRKANTPCHCPRNGGSRVNHVVSETLRKGKHALGALNLQIPCSQQHWTFWISGLIAGNSSRHGQTKGLTVPATGSYHNCSSDPPDTPGGTVKLSCCPSGTVTDNVCPPLTPAGIAICKTCPAEQGNKWHSSYSISSHSCPVHMRIEIQFDIRM